MAVGSVLVTGYVHVSSMNTIPIRESIIYLPGNSPLLYLLTALQLKVVHGARVQSFSQPQDF